MGDVVISSLRGTVLSVRLDSVVIDVGGVGMAVTAAPDTLAPLRLGEEATIPTYLVVREDSLTLYGFGSEDERDTFITLQTVSGVGPRLAMAMLAVHEPDTLRRAVAEEDVKTLTRVPGVGNKSAQRIILELGEKLGPPTGGAPQPVISSNSVQSSLHQSVAGEVAEALEGLGWNAKQAEKAVTSVLASAPFADQKSSNIDVAQVLRAALQGLGGHRG